MKRHNNEFAFCHTLVSSQWALGLDSLCRAQGFVSQALWSLSGLKDPFMWLGMCVLHHEVLIGEKDSSHSHMNSFFSRKPYASRASGVFLMSLKVGTFAGINKIHEGESSVPDSELNCKMWFLPFSWVRYRHWHFPTEAVYSFSETLQRFMNLIQSLLQLGKFLIWVSLQLDCTNLIDLFI